MMKAKTNSTKDLSLKLEANAIRAVLSRKERSKKEAIELKLQAEKERLQQERELLEYERSLQLHNHRNKEYTILTKSFATVAPDGSPAYYGDNNATFGAWVPHGHGKMTYGGIVEYEGSYRNGKRDGLGRATFVDGSVWEGQFRDGHAHGAGTFTGSRSFVSQVPKKKRQVTQTQIDRVHAPVQDSDDAVALGRVVPMVKLETVESRNEVRTAVGGTGNEAQFQPVRALMKHNCIVCFESDLKPGIQIEFDDHALNITSHHCATKLPMATLIRHICNWKYLFRFHDQMNPRERKIDLEFVDKFYVRKDLPIIVLLSQLDITVDETGTYDYYTDTYGSDVLPRYGLGLGRKTEEMRSKHHAPALTTRQRQSHGRGIQNIFESGLAGIDAAKELEMKEKQVQLRRKQWAVIVEQKRILEEEERHKQIKEAEAQIASQERESLQRMRATLETEVNEAMSKYSNSVSAAQSVVSSQIT